MNPEDAADRIRQELWRCFRRAGRGTIQQTQDQLGVGESYFRDLKRSKSFDLIKLLATLEILGEDPDQFFSRAFSTFELEPPKGEPPPIVKLGRARVAELRRLEGKVSEDEE